MTDLQPDPSISDETFEWLFRPFTIGEMLVRMMGPDSFELAIQRDRLSRPAWHENYPSHMEAINYAKCIVVRERIYREEKRRRGLV